MNVTFAPRGILQIDNCRIVYRNFAGRGDKFNREGDRNFAIVIPDEDLANRLIDEGWNVKIKERRDNAGNIDRDEPPFMTLAVKVKFNDRGPACYLISGSHRVRLDEESISCLDDIDISNIDLDVRPYDWEVNGKTGRTAYLQSIEVTQEIDRFAARYAEEECPEE